MLRTRPTLAACAALACALTIVSPTSAGAANSTARTPRSAPAVRPAAVPPINEVLAQTTATAIAAGWPASGTVNGQRFVYGFDQAQVRTNRAAIVNALTSVPTLSITTAQANLTDPTTGIYVNATQSGSAWERPINIEYSDPTGSSAAFQITAGLRIKGGFSRQPQFPVHGFSLRFNKDYAGALTAPNLFGDGIGTFSSLDLKADNNASWQWGSDKSTFLREVWSRDAQQAAGDTQLHSRRVQLYLNGQYWGSYTLIERMNKDQAAAMFGGPAAGYNVLKPDDFAGYEADAGNDTDWRRLWDLTADQVVTDAEYAEIDSLIDVRSLARMITINAYTANVDAAPSVSLSSALGNNWLAVGGSGVKYKFLTTDAELSLGVDQHDQHDPTIDLWGPYPVLAANPHYQLSNFNPGWLHSALLSNKQYRMVFNDVASSLLAPGGVLDVGPSLARWNQRKAQVAPLVPADAARWGHDAPTTPFGTVFTATYGVANWQAETNWVETQFFPMRTQLARDQLRAFFIGRSSGIADGPTYGVSVRLNDPHPA